MKCDQVQAIMDALVDGEAGCWTAARAARHLRGCTLCAVALEKTQQLTEQARRRPDETAPPSLKARIAASLAAPQPASDGATRAPLGRRGARGAWSGVRTIAGRRTAFALAALGVLVVGVLLSRRPDPVYAQLRRTEAAYRHIQSVHLSGWVLGPDGRRVDLESWYARPYRAWSKRGDELEICDGRGEWRYEVGSRTADYRPIPRLDAEAWQRFFDVEKHLERARRGFAIEGLGAERVHGALLWKIRMSGEGMDERETWWLDPASGLVRQQIVERTADPGGRLWTVTARLDRIEYDAAPPPGLFTFTPPPGVQVFRGSPESRGNFAEFLSDGRVLARRRVPDGALESWVPGFSVDLLAFRRSARGDLFAVVRPGTQFPLAMELTDADGGRYVGRTLFMGGQEDKRRGYAMIFFPERPARTRGAQSYALQLHRSTGLEEESWVRDPPGQTLVRFEGLQPADGPASLDLLAQEFARREMALTLDFLRASALGLAAAQDERAAEAQTYLEDAAKRATNLGCADTHAVYLTLAELYARGGQRAEARAMLEQAHHAATYGLKNARTVTRAIEQMERLGERDVALRWTEELLTNRGFPLAPRQLLKAAQKYEVLSGDHSRATRLLEPRLAAWVRERSTLGSRDAWDMGQAFEAMGRQDLALQSYTKGLETSDLLKHYRASGGRQFRDDAERLIGAVRRLGGEEAVRRLTVR